MWCLRHVKTFCNDADEHHAVCLGFFLPVVIWWPVTRYQVGEAARLFSCEPWYVGLGMYLRLISFMGIFALLRYWGIV